MNLIGEHVDYCGGYVLPMAIERRTTLQARVFSGRRITIAGPEMPICRIELDGATVPPGEPRWSNYLRGVMAGYQARGAQLPAMEIFVTSTVPIGGGLSSSAALEVATATLLEALTGIRLPGREKALLCQRAENVYARVPCGIMDQFASVFGRAHHVLLIDCRAQTAEAIPLADHDVVVLVFDTRVKHDLAGGEYALRRQETEEAARRLSLASLRELCNTPWHTAVESLPEPLRRRARHVVSEIERVEQFAQQLRAEAWPEVGRLMQASHVSLRDDFEVSCPELDFVAERASELPGVYGCRMTGGGFGGCCVALVERSQIAEVERWLSQAYREQFGIEPATFVTQPGDGPRLRRLNGSEPSAEELTDRAHVPR